ncbi:MAG: sugar MFS transporter [Bacteroidales bacterium]|nr:sugar MFS transporter [Bacteroidales bacterium]
MVNAISAKRNMQKLVTQGFFIPLILVASLFFLWGFAHECLDVLNKHFQELMGISKAKSALVQFVFYGGYFLMAVPAGLLMQRSGYKKGIFGGLLLVSAGAFLMFPATFIQTFGSILVLLVALLFWRVTLPEVKEESHKLADDTSKNKAPGREAFDHEVSDYDISCKKLFHNRLLAVYALMNVITMIIVMAGLRWFFVVALFSTYFFMSIMFPTIFALGKKDLGPLTKKPSSLLVMAIVGGTLIPILMGHIADISTMAKEFAVPLACFAFILYFGLYGYKVRKL